MQLRFMGHSYTRCEKKSSTANVQFSGHFLGSTYRAPYSESSHIPHETIQLKFRGKSYKTSV
ncbi:MAG: DUF4278 domain-containing protein [Elainellaceae cyanobacterium]